MSWRILGSVAVVAMCLIPSSALAAPAAPPPAQSAQPAQAPTLYHRCAVGWKQADGWNGDASDDRQVMMSIATANSQNLVDEAASWCADMIASGSWEGTDKYENHDKTMLRVCNVDASPQFRFVIYSGLDDDASKSFANLQLGVSRCRILSPIGSTEFFPENPELRPYLSEL